MIRYNLSVRITEDVNHLLEQSLMFHHNDISLAINTYPGDILCTHARTDARRNSP